TEYPPINAVGAKGHRSGKHISGAERVGLVPMKRARFAPLFLATAVVIAGACSHRALADDETGDTSITVRAPVDSTNCAGSPPTITLLGLTIDVSAIEAQSPGTCAALQVGQTVEVTLASDTAPLTATALDDQGEDNQVSIQAPLQGFDTTLMTITVLGLTIDVSQASLGGADDDSEDGNSQGIGLPQLMIGQFVDVTLASNQPPLSAIQLEVINFANEVEMEVDDENGTEVDDMNDDGTPDDDVEVEVDDTVTVHMPTPSGGATTRMRKTVHFQTRTQGGVVVLSGLPTGRAKVTVTRVHNGQTSVGRRNVRV